MISMHHQPEIHVIPTKIAGSTQARPVVDASENAIRTKAEERAIREKKKIQQIELS